MKKLITIIVLISFAGMANGQYVTLLPIKDGSKSTNTEIIRINSDSTKVTVCGVELITFKALLKYEKECVADTIKAIPYESEFIIDHESYREMVSIEQLNKRGYVYAYRWVISTDPFEFEYYFIKEPTLKDFIRWLKKQYL